MFSPVQTTPIGNQSFPQRGESRLAPIWSVNVLLMLSYVLNTYVLGYFTTFYISSRNNIVLGCLGISVFNTFSCMIYTGLYIKYQKLNEAYHMFCVLMSVSMLFINVNSGVSIVSDYDILNLFCISASIVLHSILTCVSGGCSQVHQNGEGTMSVVDYISNNLEKLNLKNVSLESNSIETCSICLSLLYSRSDLSGDSSLSAQIEIQSIPPEGLGSPSVLQTSCNHIFHKQCFLEYCKSCIDRYGLSRRQQVICPLCRKILLQFIPKN